MLPNQDINFRGQPNFNGNSNQQRNTLFESRQSSPNVNYAVYLSALSLGALQKQLQTVRQKEKQFYKLNHQLKQLQKKSKIITSSTKKLSQTQQDTEDQEIAQLKAQIQGVNYDIKNIAQQGKMIKRQCSESKQHLKLLEEELEKAKHINYGILQNVNKKKEKLMQKTAVIQQLKQTQLQNHNRITSLRQEIKSLQQQSHLLQNQLTLLTEQKQAKQKNKQKLQKIITQLQKELIYQKDHQRQRHYKLSHIKDIKQELQQELISLRKEEESTIQHYEQKLEEYHNVSVLSKQSQMKIRSLQDELFVVENDVHELNLQFISQGQLLKRQQTQNTTINQEFDSITKEAIDVWNSICELIKIQQHQQNREYNQSKSNNSSNQIKFKALKVWKEIESIIELNQNQ